MVTASRGLNFESFYLGMPSGSAEACVSPYPSNRCTKAVVDISVRNNGLRMNVTLCSRHLSVKGFCKADKTYFYSSYGVAAHPTKRSWVLFECAEPRKAMGTPLVEFTSQTPTEQESRYEKTFAHSFFEPAMSPGGLVGVLLATFWQPGHGFGSRRECGESNI